jgi:hypothetical protein
MGQKLIESHHKKAYLVHAEKRDRHEAREKRKKNRKLEREELGEDDYSSSESDSDLEDQEINTVDGHMIYAAPAVVVAGNVTTYEQMTRKHREVVDVACCLGRVFPVLALRQVMETSTANGGRGWEPGSFDVCMKELMLGDIFYHYVPEEDYPCNVDHALLKQYAEMIRKLQKHRKQQTRTRELTDDTNSNAKKLHTEPPAEWLPASMLIGFCSNVMLQLALDTTTKARREELCMPLHVVLTVHRVARKLLTNLKLKKTTAGGGRTFRRRPTEDLDRIIQTSGSSNSHFGGVSTAEIMRKSPVPVLRKLNI